MQTPVKIQNETVSSEMQYSQLLILAIIAILSVLQYNLAMLSVDFTMEAASKINS